MITLAMKNPLARNDADYGPNTAPRGRITALSQQGALVMIDNPFGYIMWPGRGYMPFLNLAGHSDDTTRFLTESVMQGDVTPQDFGMEATGPAFVRTSRIRTSGVRLPKGGRAHAYRAHADTTVLGEGPTGLNTPGVGLNGLPKSFWSGVDNE